MQLFQTSLFPLFIFACLLIHVKAAPVESLPPSPPATPDIPDPAPQYGGSVTKEAILNAQQHREHYNEQRPDMHPADRQLYHNALAHAKTEAVQHQDKHGGDLQAAHTYHHGVYESAVIETFDNPVWTGEASEALEHDSLMAKAHEQLAAEQGSAKARENAKRIRDLHATGRDMDPDEKRRHEFYLRAARDSTNKYIAARRADTKPPYLSPSQVHLKKQKERSELLDKIARNRRFNEGIWNDLAHISEAHSQLAQETHGHTT